MPCPAVPGGLLGTRGPFEVREIGAFARTKPNGGQRLMNGSGGGSEPLARTTPTFLRPSSPEKLGGGAVNPLSRRAEAPMISRTAWWRTFQMLGLTCLAIVFFALKAGDGGVSVGASLPVGCSPILVHPEWQFSSTCAIVFKRVTDRFFHRLHPVTLLAELSWRRLPDRAVWPDRVGFPSEPGPLRLSIRHPLELHSIQELVPQPTVQ